MRFVSSIIIGCLISNAAFAGCRIDRPNGPGEMPVVICEDEAIQHRPAMADLMPTQQAAPPVTVNINNSPHFDGSSSGGGWVAPFIIGTLLTTIAAGYFYGKKSGVIK